MRLHLFDFIIADPVPKRFFFKFAPLPRLKKTFNPQNMLYIHPVKNCFRLDFEQIPYKLDYRVRHV